MFFTYHLFIKIIHQDLQLNATYGLKQMNSTFFYFFFFLIYGGKTISNDSKVWLALDPKQAHILRIAFLWT